MCGGEVVSDLGVLTPRAGWGEKEWMVGGRMRLAVPRQTDWTASGALDWGFPRSYHSPLHMHGLGGSGRTRRRPLPSGCAALLEPKTASECRARCYFPGLVAGCPGGCCELQAERSRHRVAAVDAVAAAAADGGGGDGDG